MKRPKLAFCLSPFLLTICAISATAKRSKLVPGQKSPSRPTNRSGFPVMQRVPSHLKASCTTSGPKSVGSGRRAWQSLCVGPPPKSLASRAKLPTAVAERVQQQYGLRREQLMLNAHAYAPLRPSCAKNLIGAYDLDAEQTRARQSVRAAVARQVVAVIGEAFTQSGPRPNSRSRTARATSPKIAASCSAAACASASTTPAPVDHVCLSW
jgi:hypothetical protein